MLLGIALAAWACVRLGIHVYNYLTFPLPLDDGEGHVLNQAVLISSGKLPYLPISQPPYIVTNYPPLFASLAALFFPLAGNYYLTAGVSVFPGLIITRLISVLSGLGIAFLIYKIALKSGANRDYAAIASLLFLAMPLVYFWFPIGKPDMLALFLGLLGFYLGVIWLDRGITFYLSLIPLILAVFTRQSEIAPFLALFIVLLIRKDKRAVVFILSYAVSIVAITFILQAVTGGEYLKHIVTYTKTQFYLARLWTTWSFFFQYFSLALIVSFYFLVKKFIKKEFSPPLLYFFFAVLISLTSGKVGSDMNYFLETIIAGQIILALFLTELSKETLRQTGMAIASVLVFLIAFDFAFLHDNRAYSYDPIRKPIKQGESTDIEFASVLVSFIKQQPGKILSEDEAFPAICRKEVIFNPFIMSELSKEGLWDQTDFVESIKNQEYDLIILRFLVTNPNNEDKPSRGGYAGWDRWTEEMEQAIKENYNNFAVIPLRRQWYIYYPNKEKPESK